MWPTNDLVCTLKDCCCPK